MRRFLLVVAVAVFVDVLLVVACWHAAKWVACGIWDAPSLSNRHNSNAKR